MSLLANVISSRRELLETGRVVLSPHLTNIPLNQKIWLMWMVIPGSHSQWCPHMKDSGFCLRVQLCCCSSAFTQSSPKGWVCLQLWGCFQTPEYLSVDFPKIIWTIMKTAEMPLPCRQVLGWVTSQNSFLAQFSTQICLKFLSWEIRDSSEVPRAFLLCWALTMDARETGAGAFLHWNFTPLGNPMWNVPGG